MAWLKKVAPAQWAQAPEVVALRQPLANLCGGAAIDTPVEAALVKKDQRQTGNVALFIAARR